MSKSYSGGWNGEITCSKSSSIAQIRGKEYLLIKTFEHAYHVSSQQDLHHCSTVIGKTGKDKCEIPQRFVGFRSNREINNLIQLQSLTQ